MVALFPPPPLIFPSKLKGYTCLENFKSFEAKLVPTSNINLDCKYF